MKRFPKDKTETFDVWSEAHFTMWSIVRYDFELIAELTRYRKSTRLCLEILDTVNKNLKGAPKEVFFDGTIRCLKYLVKNKFLNLSDLPSLTKDEKYLIELLKKYSKRLDITEVISDIEEPTVRAILLEYPNLINEMLTDNPIAGHFMGQVMLKHGITDSDSLLKKVDDGLTSVEVDSDKNSKEAMKCKIIYLGLRINNGKIFLSKNSKETINQFSSLTDDSVENETYNRPTFNALYGAFYGSDKWNQEKKSHLTGCETLNVDFQLLSLPDNHMSLIYEIFLKEETEKIGKKYFGEEFRYEGSTVSLAVKMALVIILFRAENFIPEGETPEVSLFSPGAMIGALNYAVKETKNKQKPLKLKKWFLDYFKSELDKRMAFIKLQFDNRVGIFKMGSKERVVYIPVFESFKFFCSKQGLLEHTIELLKNESIQYDIKDDIFINFVINIQKIIGSKKPTKEEIYFKDVFILLITETFEGLVVNQVKNLEHQAQKYYKWEDLKGDGLLAVLKLIKNFDLSKSDSFIAYLKFNLPLEIKTSSRRLKGNDDSMTNTNSHLSNSEQDFIGNIPDTDDFVKKIDDEMSLKKINDYIDKLPPKEKEAVKKRAECNERLSSAERKADYRGLNKVRRMIDTS